MKELRELNPSELELMTIDLRTSTQVSFDITNLNNRKIRQLIKILQAGKKIKGWSLIEIKLCGNDVHIEAVKPNKINVNN